ncbi:MAG: amidohydrolase family protein [Candidatus Bipolaricaulota bacterium]|nr:MAG: amidohydrolase family protein [Candidatus Bipolaricaulota bacterium]
MPPRWRDLPKIDFHAHVVLHERENTDLVVNRPERLLDEMNTHGIEAAVVLPINYPSYFPLRADEQADWVAANNDRQAALMHESGGRFLAFADVGVTEGYERAARLEAELVRAVERLGLRGIKVHPTNLKLAADDPRLLPAVDVAERYGLPLVFHSNPAARDRDFYGSAPSRVYRAMHGRNPSYVLAHLGGVAYLESLAGECHVGISGTILWLLELYGPSFCRALLRRIGVERVVFGSDVPIYAYEAYDDVFDALRLTTTEMELIAYGNARAPAPPPARRLRRGTSPPPSLPAEDTPPRHG